MNMVLIEQIVSVLMQAVEAGIKYGPAIISDIKLAYALASSGSAMTDDQKLQADTAVANAHAALQAQIQQDAIIDG